MTPRMLASCIAFGAASCALAQPQVIFVDDTAPPGGDGSSWAGAYTDLQDALDEANAHSIETEIRIAAGVYRPDRGTGDRDMSFTLRGGGALLGGFPDGGGEMHDRDRDAHPTVLTGDLAGNDSADAASRAENSRVIVLAAPGVGDIAAIDGVVIERGESDLRGVGAGVRTSTGLPVLVIRDCVLRWNRASGGGALGREQSLPRTDVDVRDSLFFQNSARFSGGAVFDVDGRYVNTRFIENQADEGAGGAIVADAAHFERCEFIRNRTLVATAGDGGAVQSYAGSSFEACDFTENSAARHGGAVFGDGNFRDCRFTRNSAGMDGGAVASYGGPYFWRSIFFANTAAGSGGAFAGESNGTAFDSVFAANTAAGFGGAVHQALELARCTIVQNHAGQHGGVSASYARHSIIWGNTDAAHPAGTPLAQSSYLSDSPSLRLLIEGFEANGVTAATTPDDVFVDYLGPDGAAATGDEDFRLSAGSPAIDAGWTFEQDPYWGVRDGRSQMRFVAIKGNESDSPASDIGAFEAQDVNRDGIADAGQIRSGVLADCNGDGVADVASVGSLSVAVTERVTLDPDGLAKTAAAGVAESGALIAQVRTPRNTFAVDLLRKSHAGWVVEETLAPIPGAQQPGTACWAADVEDELAASLWWHDNGIFVQVHERIGEGWSATGLLGPLPAPPEVGDIKVSGGQIVVRTGPSLQIYGRVAGAWTLEQEFEVGLSGGVYDIRDTAIEGDLLVVAGVATDPRRPQALVFVRSSTGWAPHGEVPLAPIEPAEVYEIHLDLRGDLLAVAFRGVAGAGSVQAFRWNAGAWDFEGSIGPPLSTASATFATGVATDGRLIAIDFRANSWASDTQHAVYRRHDGSWTLDALVEISPPKFSSSDQPWSTAFVDGSLLVRRSDIRQFQKIVSVTEVAQAFSAVAADANNNDIPDDCESPCPADLTGDAAVDGADLGRLLAAMGSSAGAADLNADGVVNGADLGLLIEAWGMCQ